MLESKDHPRGSGKILRWNVRAFATSLRLAIGNARDITQPCAACRAFGACPASEIEMGQWSPRALCEVKAANSKSDVHGSTPARRKQQIIGQG
jgi:hypothetical protein